MPDEAGRSAGPRHPTPASDRRCLLICNIFPPIHGGSAVVYESLARHGDRRLVVLAPYRHYQTGRVLVGWRDFDQGAPYTVHRLELLRPRQILSASLLHSLWRSLKIDLPLSLTTLWHVRRLVRKEQIAVVCIGELNSGGWIGLLSKYLLGCPVIFYIHGEEITTKFNYRLFGRNRRLFLRLADAVVVVSNFTRCAVTDFVAETAGRIEVITNGVDLQRFRPRPKRSDLLARYGVHGHRVLLSVGRLIERKGIDRVLQALPLLAARHPLIRYVIVGEGPYRSRLEQIAEEAGVRQHVVFAGSIPEADLVDHYALCDLFVLPNRELADGDTEGFGLVFVEANACGKPVIGGRAGGAVEAVRHEETGLLVDGNDVGAIADALDRLLSDDDLYRRLADGGLATARLSGWDLRARQFMALCDRLAGERRRPRRWSAGRPGR